MPPTTDAVEADAPDVEKVAEFPSDEHRKTHIAALVQEKNAYEVKAAGFTKRGDDAQAGYYKGRASEVQDELDRLASDAKKPSQRAERR
jgi:hypothetical protein